MKKMEAEEIKSVIKALSQEAYRNVRCRVYALSVP